MLLNSVCEVQLTVHVSSGPGPRMSFFIATLSCQSDPTLLLHESFPAFFFWYKTIFHFSSEQLKSNDGMMSPWLLALGFLLCSGSDQVGTDRGLRDAECPVFQVRQTHQAVWLEPETTSSHSA